LIPVEEFLATHPDHINDDEDALMEARINHEREERETLEQQRLELQKRKQKLIAENKKRRDDLANLDKDLEKFIDVSVHISTTLLLFRANGLGDRLPNRYRNFLRK
jgi:THO complex subunit 5